MAKHFINLKTLNLNNTPELEKLKANKLIENVTLENSNILAINSFKKKVPEPLLERNNMANYTQVKLNGVLLTELEINKLKLGKMNVEHNDTLEILDGVLANTTFTIVLENPLNQVFQDPVLLYYIKDLLNKESVTSSVSAYELQTITWLGKNPQDVTENNYLGYFNTKTISNFEIFKSDLKKLPNLQYVNLSGAIFSADINLDDFNFSNFKYSFADCVLVQNVTINKVIENMEGAFKNCQNLRTITIGENAELNNTSKAFFGCKGILNFTIQNPNITDTNNENIFEEALISVSTFINEPLNNTITSNILKYALLNSITINLDNKDRPDLYNLTESINNVTENITLNNTNIINFDLTSNNFNFTNLKNINLNNTFFLLNLKLNGEKISNVIITNSKLNEINMVKPGTPNLFIDNKKYYNSILLNGTEMKMEDVESIKQGKYIFSNNDQVTISSGALNNFSTTLKMGIPATGLQINEIFKDETLSEYIRIKTNKASITDVITQAHLDNISYFGYDGIQMADSDVSWFKGKIVNSWDGTEFLKNIQNVYLNGVLGEADKIVIRSIEIRSLDYAFYNCTSLKEIDLPNNAKFINNLQYTFSGCTALTSVTLPSYLSYVVKMKNTFSGCTALTSITLPSSMPKITSFDFTFENCSSLTSVTLPLTIPLTTEMKNTFSGCTALTSVTLPSYSPLLTDLEYLFFKCTNLISVVFPNELPNLKSLFSTFSGCTALTSVNLPNELLNLINLEQTFENCSSISVVTLPQKILKLKELTFTFKHCTSLTSVIFPKEIGITKLNNTFYGCTGLKNITLPKELVSVIEMKNTFSGCTTLTSVIFNSSMSSIIDMSYAFLNCSSLTSIIMPIELPNLTSLYYTFSGCTALTSITLPCVLKNLTTTLKDTFLENPNTLYIYHPNEKIDDLGKITLHPNLGLKDYSNLINLLTFAEAFMDENLSDYLCSKLNFSSTSFMDSSKLDFISKLKDFPDGINNFFGLKYCKNLAYVSFENNITYRVINLKHCTNIKSFHKSFSGCINLENLELPDNLKEVKNFKDIILGCSKISRICIPGDNFNNNINILQNNFDKKDIVLELKGNVKKFEKLITIKKVIKANLHFSNDLYEKPLNFYFKPNLEKIIKEKLSLNSENEIVTKNQLDGITELTLDSLIEDSLSLSILKNLTTLTVNVSGNLLDLRYLTNITNITINNCPNLKELFLPINNNCIKNLNLTINGENNIKEIFINKNVNLSYSEFYKNLKKEVNK